MLTEHVIKLAHLHCHLYLQKFLLKQRSQFWWDYSIQKWKMKSVNALVCVSVCVDYRLEDTVEKRQLSFLMTICQSSPLTAPPLSSACLLFFQPRPPLFSLTCTKHPSLGHSLPVPTRWLWQQSASFYVFVLPFLSLPLSLPTSVSLYIYLKIFFFLYFYWNVR